MTAATYTITGMTCGHCVAAVTHALQSIPGVAGVDIDLPTGVVTVTSDTPVDHEQLAAAIDDAGYTLA